MSIRFFYLCAALCCLLAQTGLAQKNTDAVAQRVIRHLGASQLDSVYLLTNSVFQQKVPKTGFIALGKQLAQLGGLQESAFLAESGGIRSYKLVFDNASLQMKIGLDSTGLISTLLLQPFREPAKQKPQLVPSSNPRATAFDQRADSLVRGYIQQEHTVGISVGLLKDGVVRTYGYGSTSKTKTTLPDAHSIFEIGSVTKTFTSLLLAYYSVQGKLSLEDPVTKYLPDSVAQNKKLQAVRLKHLANHTSGLPRLPVNLLLGNADSLNPYAHYGPAMMLSFLKVASPSSPGEEYAYSNLGMGLLGYILEQAGGKPYETLVRELITRPLGMRSTFITLPAQYKDKMVTVYREDGRETPAWDFQVMAAAGALRSTVQDLLLYARAQMTPPAGKLGQAIALTQQISYDKGTTVGMGWHVTKLGETDVYVHTGGTYGSSSMVLFAPKEQLAVVLLANSALSVDETGKKLMLWLLEEGRKQ